MEGVKLCKECGRSDVKFGIDQTKVSDKIYPHERLTCTPCRYKQDYPRRIRRMFGLIYEEVEHLIYGLCEICGKEEPKRNTNKLCLDHDHITGEFRGFLCSECNSGLGKFKDSVENLEKAIQYLESWRK